MKLTNVALFSNDREVANFSFRDPSHTSPYTAKKITGIDADSIVPKFYGVSGTSKTKYYAPSLEERVIVIAISLNPAYSKGQTHSDLRDDLYRAVYSSRSGIIQLRFNDKLNTVAAVTGFVTRFDTTHFSNNPEVHLTIKCEYPMLRSLEPVKENAFALETLNTIVDARSTAPHGFSFKITFDEVAKAFVIRDKAVDSEWEFRVEPLTIGADTGFLVDDQLCFSSEVDNKYLYVIRSGVTIHLVDWLKAGSVWPIIFPGPNDLEFFSVDAVEAAQDYTWDELTYYASYWGV